MSADIGLIGLAVMGQNLVLNMNDNGYKVCVYNRTYQKTEDFLKGPAKGTEVIGAKDLKEFISTLKRPRKVMLMVKAGKPVDDMMDQILPLLQPGDVLIDGGNSLYTDTTRRVKACQEKGIFYVGAGISGGEEGARHGPSIMPGGHPQAWPLVKDIFQSISAKVDGMPCCDWVGDGGAGHFVKMVHNGIEYGDMQLICEVYHLLSEALGLQADDLHEVFAKWNQGKLDSYLIEISRDIFKFKDEDNQPLVEKILDVAGQKGTGKWTGINALELGIPLTLIGEAVFARFLSSIKEERIEASKYLKGPASVIFSGSSETLIQDTEAALYAAKIISYAQGFMLIRQAAQEFQWRLNYGAIALMWRGGCIIRSRFLGNIKEAFDKKSNLVNLLLDDFFKDALHQSQASFRRVLVCAIEHGIPMPCMTSALSFYDGYRRQKLPQNLLQAQRDFFGAHTYERIDRPRGEFFHTNWTGHGGSVSSSSYNA